jgi:hypothetical protein
VDAERSDLGLERLHPALQSELRRGVGRTELKADQARARRDRDAVARALLAHDGQDGAGDVHRADEGRRQLPLDLLRRQLLEVTRIEGPALLTSTSMRPKRSTAARTACSASSVLVTSSLTASRSSAWPTASATASRLRPVATNRVAGGQGSLGELQAHAPPSASDEPDLLVGHSSLQAGSGQSLHLEESKARRQLRGPVDGVPAASPAPAPGGGRWPRGTLFVSRAGAGERSLGHDGILA